MYTKGLPCVWPVIVTWPLPIGPSWMRRKSFTGAPFGPVDTSTDTINRLSPLGAVWT